MGHYTGGGADKQESYAMKIMPSGTIRKAQEEEDLIGDITTTVMNESSFGQWWYTEPKDVDIANLAAESASLETPVVQMAQVWGKKPCASRQQRP